MKHEDENLDFDFEDDDYDILEDQDDDVIDLDSDTQSNVQDNMKEMADRVSNDNEDDVPLEENNQQSAEAENVIDKELVLYILTDRLTSNLRNYFRKSGVPVTNIFNNTKDAEDQMMFEMDPCRLVIVDTGLGKFTGITSREEIIEILSLADDEHHMTVFYTDKFLKNEVRDSLKVDYKKIKWFKYKSTADTVARLLISKEKYVINEDSEETEETADQIFATKGVNQIIKEGEKHMSIGSPSITVEQLVKNFESPDYEEVKAFKVKY
jgi:hypothetical protein